MSPPNSRILIVAGLSVVLLLLAVLGVAWLIREKWGPFEVKSVIIK